MATTFRMEVERFKAELVQQVQPGTGAVDVYLRTNSSEEEEMAAGAASGEIDAMLQRPVVLHFADGRRVEWRKEAYDTQYGVCSRRTCEEYHMTEDEPTPMTHASAGRKGGDLVRDTYGEDYYRRIGTKGGTTLKEKRGHEYFRQIARQGGEANLRKYGPDHFAEMGKKGGNTTKERQGSDFYRRIGKMGGAARQHARKAKRLCVNEVSIETRGEQE